MDILLASIIIVAISTIALVWRSEYSRRLPPNVRRAPRRRSMKTLARRRDPRVVRQPVSATRPLRPRHRRAW